MSDTSLPRKRDRQDDVTAGSLESRSALRALGLAPLLTQVVQSPAKRALYETDTYFREALVDWLSVASPRAYDALRPLASIVLKPDAIVGRRARPALEWIVRRGFVPVAYATFRYDRLMIREAWRYQFNIASADRIAIVDDLLTAAPSLYVLFSDNAAVRAGAARLAGLKGPAEPRFRREGQLRHHLCASSTLLNFVHTADDEADVIREWGVYFDSATRRYLMERALGGRDASEEVSTALASIEESWPEHDLALAAAVEDIRALCAAARNDSRHPAGALASVEQHLTHIATGHSRDWRALFNAMQGARLEPSSWTRIVIATALLECDVPGVMPLLD